MLTVLQQIPLWVDKRKVVIIYIYSINSYYLYLLYI